MEEKIRIVVVDDVVQTRTDIKRLLFFEEDMEVVGEAENGKDAIEIVRNLKPDVVLMDINMPVMDGITATENIAMAFPDISVVIISIQGEQEYLKKAMVAGAKDYLVKPLGSEEMSTTIRQAYQANQKRRVKGPHESEPASVKSQQLLTQYQTIAFFCGKGGIGKTTLASNVAVALAQSKLKVALVDLDLQFGDISVLFNLNDSRTIGDLVHEEGSLKDLVDQYLIRHISGVHVLSAPLFPQEAEKIKLEHIEEILAYLKESFDCIIIDTAASFTDISLLALDAADLILVPVRRDISSIKNVKTTLNILNSLDYSKKTNVILNQSDLNLGIEITDLERSLDSAIMHLISSDEKTVVTSVNKGVPLVMDNSNSEIAKNIQKLSQKIVNGFNYKASSAVSKKGTKIQFFNF